jgi:hypothetical protein
VPLLTRNRISIAAENIQQWVSVTHLPLGTLSRERLQLHVEVTQLSLLRTLTVKTLRQRVRVTSVASNDAHGAHGVVMILAARGLIRDPSIKLIAEQATRYLKRRIMDLQ